MMQKQELFKELTSLGILTEPDAIVALEENPELLEEIRRMPEKPLILNQAFLSGLKRSFSMIVSEQKNQISLQDYVDSLFRKYEALKQVLMEKTDKKNLVSLGSATDGFASVIALVRSVSDARIEIEDPSGIIEAVFSKDLPLEMKAVKEGDVVGIQGVVRGRRLFVTSIVWPDIDEKEPATPSFSIAFVFDSKPREEADYTVFVDCRRDFSVQNSVQVKTENPVIIRIKGFSILLARSVDAVDALKRRYIKNKPFDFVLETIPDAFLCINEGEEKRNYKNIPIFNLKPKGTFLLNANTIR